MIFIIVLTKRIAVCYYTHKTILGVFLKYNVYFTNLLNSFETEKNNTYQFVEHYLNCIVLILVGPRDKMFLEGPGGGGVVRGTYANRCYT